MFRRNKGGFTLIELVVTLAIMGIVAAVAVPSLLAFLPGYRLRAATRDLVSALREARLEAVKRNRTCHVSFNESVAGTTYDYVIWFDNDDDDAIDSGEPILKANLSQYPGVRFDTSKGKGNGLNFDGQSFVFTSTGLIAQRRDGKIQQVDALEGAVPSIFLKNDKGAEREISFTLAGATRVES